MTRDPIPHAPESEPRSCKAPGGVCVYLGQCNTNRYGCHAALANPTPAPSGDEVAALRAKITELCKDGAFMVMQRHDSRASAAELRATIAEARVKVLEEALKPFAEEAEFWPITQFDDGHKLFNGDLDLGHLRRARAALSQAQGGENGQ